MDYWRDFKLSEAAQIRLKSILPKLDSEQFSNDWCSLMEINKNDSGDSSKMDVDLIEFDTKEIENFKSLLKEALETSTLLSETAVPDLSSNAFSLIFSDVKCDLDDLKFSTFCDLVISCRNDILTEQALQAVVLPKLQEKKESSSCTIFAVAKLASAIPDKFCNLVLIPLLTESNVYFSDVELMSNVFSKLPLPSKELVIMNFTRKCEFYDSDWLLLQPLVKEFSRNSIIMLTKCIHRQSSSFTKSHAFGKFLVSFCKSINFLDDKKLILEAVNTHQTLLKRQALKYLEKL